MEILVLLAVCVFVPPLVENRTSLPVAATGPLVTRDPNSFLLLHVGLTSKCKICIYTDENLSSAVTKTNVCGRKKKT